MLSERARVRRRTAPRHPTASMPAVAAGVVRAFVERSILVALSYRTRFALGFGSLGLSVLTFLYVGKAVALSGTGFVERYGIGYAPFALIGTVVHGVAATGLGAFRAAVRREQVQGTLETLACAPAWARPRSGRRSRRSSSTPPRCAAWAWPRRGSCS